MSDTLYWLSAPILVLIAIHLLLRLFNPARSFISFSTCLRLVIIAAFLALFAINEPSTAHFLKKYSITPSPILALALGLFLGPLLFVVSQNLEWLSYETLPQLDTRLKQSMFILLLPLLEEILFRLYAIEWFKALPAWQGIALCMIGWILWRITPNYKEWAFPLIMGFLLLIIAWLTQQIYSTVLAHILLHYLIYLKQQKQLKQRVAS